jgi:hypothetical protein
MMVVGDLRSRCFYCYCHDLRGGVLLVVTLGVCWGRVRALGSAWWYVCLQLATSVVRLAWCQQSHT